MRVARLESEFPFLLMRLRPNGFVSVNLSVRELVDNEILERLRHGPLATQADRLVLEITESMELQAVTDAECHLAELRAVGYRVALDDFGAGFSNLGRLEQLHPDMIKVDQSLIARAGCGRKGGQAFLAAAVSVAECLDCDLVAEGCRRPTRSRRCATWGFGWYRGTGSANRYPSNGGPVDLLRSSGGNRSTGNPPTRLGSMGRP